MGAYDGQVQHSNGMTAISFDSVLLITMPYRVESSQHDSKW